MILFKQPAQRFYIDVGARVSDCQREGMVGVLGEKMLDSWMARKPLAPVMMVLPQSGSTCRLLSEVQK